MRVRSDAERWSLVLRYSVYQRFLEYRIRCRGCNAVNRIEHTWESLFCWGKQVSPLSCWTRKMSCRAMSSTTPEEPDLLQPEGLYCGLRCATQLLGCLCALPRQKRWTARQGLRLYQLA